MIFYVLLFVGLYLQNRKYNSPAVNFVLLFYVAASICGVLTHIFIEPNAYCTFLSVLFQSLCIFLFVYPIITYGKQEKKRAFRLLPDQRFKFLAYVLIALQMFTIAFFAGYVFNLLARGDLGQIRSEMLAGELDLGASLGRTIAGVASYYYCFNILLFFYSLAFRKDSKWLLLLLIITSTSRIFHSLTYMGRDGILFWILSFIFSYCIFKPYLRQESLKLIRKIALLVGGGAAVMIILISISRFGDSDTGVLASLISYFGQPLNNFGQLFDKFHEYTGTKSIFPLLYGESGSSGTDAIANSESFYIRYGFYSNIFFSFVGNMYKAWGPFLTLIISALYSALMTNILRRRTTSMSMLIILMFVSQIVLHNYFYWAYNIKVGNLFIFTLPIFVIYCGKTNGVVNTSYCK